MTKGLFPTYHPAVCMLFFLAAIFFAFSSTHPVYVVCTLAMAAAYLVYLKGAKEAGKSLLLAIPFVLFIALLNFVFSPNGATVLVQFFDADIPIPTPFGTYSFHWNFRITLEGFYYGLAMGGMLTSVILWFACYNEVMTDDKFTYLFGKVMPTLALMVSMISRWVPSMVTRGRRVYESQEALLGGYDTSKKGRVNRGLRMATVLAALGMEDSIQTSDSMRARGYGTVKRTSYAQYKWHAREYAALVFLVVLIVVNAAGMFLATADFAYYPRMSPIEPWWGYATYVLMLALPLLTELEAVSHAIR